MVDRAAALRVPRRQNLFDNFVGRWSAARRVGGALGKQFGDAAEFGVGVLGPVAQELEGGVGVDAVVAHQDAFGLFDHRLAGQPLAQAFVLREQRRKIDQRHVGLEGGGLPLGCSNLQGNALAG